MNITGVSSLTDALASQATDMKASQVSQQISTTVLKSVLDQQKQAGEQLVQMIRQTPSADGAGKLVDILA